MHFSTFTAFTLFFSLPLLATASPLAEARSAGTGSFTCEGSIMGRVGNPVCCNKSAVVNNGDPWNLQAGNGDPCWFSPSSIPSDPAADAHGDCLGHDNVVGLCCSPPFQMVAFGPDPNTFKIAPVSCYDPSVSDVNSTN